MFTLNTVCVSIDYNARLEGVFKESEGGETRLCVTFYLSKMDKMDA